MHTVIKNSLNELNKLCRDYKVTKLYTFGSVNTDRFDIQKSDLDIIVELPPMDPEEKGELLIDLWDRLEELFQRKVDLLSKPRVDNPYLQMGIDKTKKLIYEA
jgi:predicted nucleotidyltransferase